MKKEDFKVVDWEEKEVYSEKYEIIGKIRNWGGLVKKLQFTYEGREIEIGLETSFGFFFDEKEEAIAIMEDYIENLHTKEQKVMLHYWCLTLRNGGEEQFTQAQGIVTGHYRIADSRYLYSSEVKEIKIDWDEEEALIQTMNTLYHCPLEYIDFKKQDESPELLPDYEEIKERYKDKRQDPTIEPGKVLTVFSNYDDYYFHSLFYIPEGEAEPVEYSAYPHIGTFQDSYLIEAWEKGIDIRYFPHMGNVEFYSESTNGCPWFIENIGSGTLYFQTRVGLIKLDPGERKRVKKENTEKEKPALSGGDLYPAGVIE